MLVLHERRKYLSSVFFIVIYISFSFGPLLVNVLSEFVLGFTEILLCPLFCCLCKNCSFARSLLAANVCRGMDLFESAVFGALILANILSHVPCTEQQKRFICVNS